MSALGWVADFWDELTAQWLDGADPLPRWYASYRGRGEGEVTREAFAEPNIGDVRGSPRLITLGLNPGTPLFAYMLATGSSPRRSASLAPTLPGLRATPI